MVYSIFKSSIFTKESKTAVNRTTTSQFKRKIAASFGAKVAGYTDHAHIQQALLDRLVPLIMQYDTPGSLWIDAGCGNGALENKLAASHFKGTLLALDIAKASLSFGASKSTAHNVHWLCADIEHPPLKPACASGIISASVLQWFPTMNTVLDSLQQLLSTNGFFAFSIFTGQSFHELSAIRSRFGLPDPVQCPPPEALHDLFTQNNLTFISTEPFSQTLFFPSAMDVLRHLSAIGSTSMPSSRMSRHSLQKFCTMYEDTFASSGGVPLTYEARFGICRKDGTHA